MTDGVMWCSECRQMVEPVERWNDDGGYYYDACPVCGGQLDDTDECPICEGPKDKGEEFCEKCRHEIAYDVRALLDKWRPHGGDLAELKYFINEVLDD